MQQLTIANLPKAGVKVELRVTVTDPQGLHAEGKFLFKTVKADNSLTALSRELQCRLSGFRNGSLRLPPWVIPEKTGNPHEWLANVERQIDELSRVATQMAALIKTMKTMIKEDGVKASGSAEAILDRRNDGIV